MTFNNPPLPSLQPYALPLMKGNCRDLKCISPETVSWNGVIILISYNYCHLLVCRCVTFSMANTVMLLTSTTLLTVGSLMNTKEGISEGQRIFGCKNSSWKLSSLDLWNTLETSAEKSSSSIVNSLPREALKCERNRNLSAN